MIRGSPSWRRAGRRRALGRFRTSPACRDGSGCRARRPAAAPATAGPPRTRRPSRSPAGAEGGGAERSPERRLRTPDRGPPRRSISLFSRPVARPGDRSIRACRLFDAHLSRQPGLVHGAGQSSIGERVREVEQRARWCGDGDPVVDRDVGWGEGARLDDHTAQAVTGWGGHVDLAVMSAMPQPHRAPPDSWLRTPSSPHASTAAIADCGAREERGRSHRRRGGVCGGAGPYAVVDLLAGQAEIGELAASGARRAGAWLAQRWSDRASWAWRPGVWSVDIEYWCPVTTPRARMRPGGANPADACETSVPPHRFGANRGSRTPSHWRPPLVPPLWSPPFGAPLWSPP